MALEATSTVATDRQAVRQQWIDNNLARFLGIPAFQENAWTTGHGDLHWTNLTGPPLIMLDWEGWGLVPVGFDAGLLHAYSLNRPATAARIRAEFAHILDTPAGRPGELVALAELLQVAGRGGHPDLAPHLARPAEHLTGTPVTVQEIPVPPSLLAVFAHPNDESLLAGGVLAQHHAAGARTAVVTATWAPGSRREPELADALAVLGAGTPRLLGYNDARKPRPRPASPGSSTLPSTKRSAASSPTSATSAPTSSSPTTRSAS